jgi:hypothetical protein
MTAPRPALIPWYRKPLWLALLGLALMVGGWKLITWKPPLPEKVAELGRKGDEEYRDRLEQMRPEPYLLPGRLVFLAGTILFIAAGVQMFRQPPAPPPEAEDQDEEDLADAHLEEH